MKYDIIKKIKKIPGIAINLFVSVLVVITLTTVGIGILSPVSLPTLPQVMLFTAAVISQPMAAIGFIVLVLSLTMDKSRNQKKVRQEAMKNIMSEKADIKIQRDILDEENRQLVNRNTKLIRFIMHARENWTMPECEEEFDAYVRGFFSPRIAKVILGE